MKRMNMHRISSVTVCKNCKNDLIRTLESVKKQTFLDYEVLVIDGNSTDGTKEILEKYRAIFQKMGIDFIAISEVDDGIYDAMNKGIKLANGEWCIFLNAGDCMASENVFFNVFSANSFVDISAIYGNYTVVYKNRKKHIKCKQMSDFKNRKPSSHQAFFIRTESLKKRPYSTSYKIMGDYEWFFNLYLNGGNFLYIDQDICYFDGYGISAIKKYQCYDECMKIRKQAGIKRDNIAVRFCKKAVWLFVGFMRKHFGILYW